MTLTGTAQAGTACLPYHDCHDHRNPHLVDEVCRRCFNCLDLLQDIELSADDGSSSDVAHLLRMTAHI